MSYPIYTSIHLFFKPDGATLNAQIERHIAAGFRFLDFNFLDWAAVPDCPFWSEDWRAWIDSARETAERHGARFNQAHAPCPEQNLKSDLNLYETACARAFEACKMLGVPWMVFHHVNNPAQYGSALSKFEFDRAFFTRMLEHAHRCGVGIAIENLFNGGAVNGEMKNPVDYAIALADALDDPLAGVCCDTGHCHIAQYNLLGRADDTINPADDIRRIGGRRLKALHIHDNRTHGDDHIPPFYGSIDWADVMRALDEIGYEHSFTFEAHNAARGLPEPLKDEGARLLYRMGEALTGSMAK